MKINIKQIPPGGLAIKEAISADTLDLETEEVKFRGTVGISGIVTRITNAVTVELNLIAPINTECSRCLKETGINLEKKLKLNYQVSGQEQFIDIGPDIREEIILDYPIKPLCKPDCKGLCPRCGNSLNEGGCNCGST